MAKPRINEIAAAWTSGGISVGIAGTLPNAVGDVPGTEQPRWQAATMDEPTRTRTALVTGGSRGIGAAPPCCWPTGAGTWRSRTGWQRTRPATSSTRVGRADGGRWPSRPTWRLDGDIAAVFERVDGGLGPLGAVVNNAGVVSPSGRVDSYDTARLDAVLRINVVAAFLVAGAAVRRMSTARGGQGGVIVNVSSRAAVLGSAGEYVDYAASKAAVDAMTVGLANEVAAEGIRVVGVRPG